MYSVYNYDLCTTEAILASAYNEGSAKDSLDALGFDRSIYSHHLLVP